MRKFWVVTLLGYSLLVSSPTPGQGTLGATKGTAYLNPAAFADPPASPDNGFALRIGN